jgi:N,N'-diacetyllegionaminate synthase
VELLDGIGVPAFKFASEDLINVELLRFAAGRGRPILLSTGMAGEREIEIALDIIADHGGAPVLLMHCTSVYPTPASSCNLRRIQALKRRFGLPVGFSDHTEGCEAPVAAVAMGAVVIEKHFTLNRHLPGPDHSMSMEPREFSTMVGKIRRLEVLFGCDRVEYDPIEEHSRMNFRRSIVAARDIPCGHRLNKDDLAYKRPGYGLKPYEQDLLLGKIVTREVRKNELIALEDVR